MYDNFIYWLTNVAYAPLRDSAYDLIIVESGETFRALDYSGLPSGLAPSLTPAQLAVLQQNGTPANPADDRPVLGYVNVAVTDHNRAFWDFAWVVPDEIANPDVGSVQPGAPYWLSGALGEARGPRAAGDLPAPDNPDQTIYGPVVDFVSPAPAGQTSWTQIVVDQALAVFDAGYDGVFLDDVSRYYLTGGVVGGTTLAERADAMIALVNTVAAALDAAADAAGRPDPLIAINGDAYITWNNGTPVSAGDAAFFDAVDLLLMENLFTTAPYALDAAATLWAGQAQILSVEWQDTLQAPGAYDAFAETRGILTHIPDDAGYDEFTPLPGGPAPAAEYTVIVGTWTADNITGTPGDDLLLGQGGADRLFGMGGDDRMIGGARPDRIVPGAGQDRLWHGDGPAGLLDADELMWL